MPFEKRKSVIVGLAIVLVGATLLGPSVAFGRPAPVSSAPKRSAMAGVNQHGRSRGIR
jgi:hypothetical protein